MVQFTLIRPVIDNRNAFKELFAPGAVYLGDIGDATHLAGSGDHTPWASDVIFGRRHLRGFVYAQDLGFGGRFDSDDVLPWLDFHLAAGRYREVKYRIGRLVLKDRRYNWRKQRGVDDKHLHLSYMPGFEHAASTLIRDLDAWMKAGKPALGPSARHLSNFSVLQRANIVNGGPLPIPALSVGTYSTRTLNKLPYFAWPPIVRGYGGPENKQQRDFVTGFHKLATETYKTTMIPAAELDRAEIGAGTISFAHMIVTARAGMPWMNDPGTNGRRLGFALGAPTSF
jgi:hypothetical protein